MPLLDSVITRLYIFSLLVLLCLIGCFDNRDQIATTQVWDTMTLDFEGPETGEEDDVNPFLDYRLDVTFTKGSIEFVVPGYYAADGNAAETSATKGNIWRVKFTPHEPGYWSFTANFRKENDIAVSMKKDIGIKIPLEFGDGRFKVVAREHNKDKFNFNNRMTEVDSVTYIIYTAEKMSNVRGSSSQPDLFLSNQDFDGAPNLNNTYATSLSNNSYQEKWSKRDPNWQNGKGKEAIGTLNHLSSIGVEAVYLLPIRSMGNSKNVWPFASSEDFDRFDCSKLDQWEIVFEHAQTKGIQLHFVLQKEEAQMLLDRGESGKYLKLFYREFVARFAHHLAISWNLERNDDPSDEFQNATLQNSEIEFLQSVDPYDNAIVIHSPTVNENRDSMSTEIKNINR